MLGRTNLTRWVVDFSTVSMPSPFISVQVVDGEKDHDRDFKGITVEARGNRDGEAGNLTYHIRI
ncbi:hypothetical protein TIFTF001_013248 [Ficus carica]|uniref:Uncharacterized protein n=1 Tax=Ficus carica TaxID=3494 RepID=A0AA88A0M7_FICCA|nr:hypothetical protein TIFTF001_013248 [Ficus carica]